MKKFKRIGNHLLTLMANILYRTGISDLLSGYWGFRREVVNELKRFKDEWVTWEEKRQKAARDRMIRLGHEHGP